MRYDIGIVGGGPGGYSAAFEAAQNGLKVILFEKDKLGGTCLNRGCIPTKYLVHIANIRTELALLQKFGVTVTKNKLDLGQIQKKMYLVTDELRNNLEGSISKAKIDVVHGTAIVEKAGTIFCNSNLYQVENIIIATGATVKKPLSNGFWNSNDVLGMDYLPKSLKIVGGGTVAVEFAQIFARLGADVKIQIRGERLLKNWNREVSASVTKILKDEGIQVETKCLEDDLKKCDAEVCISALGMQPSLTGLSKELFEIGELGGIMVDKIGETKTKGIYAVGDVVEGSTQLAHHAMEEGRRTVRHIMGSDIADKVVRVRCIYMNPEIAEVGYTEEQAKLANISIVSAKVPLYSNSMNMIYGGRRGYIKLIADKEEGLLIGAQIMGERASDLISELCLAVNAGLPVRKCAEIVRPHPSFSEGLSEAFLALKDKL